MSDILAKIMATKRREIEQAISIARAQSWESRARDLAPPADFLAAIRSHAPVAVIAEIKKASPSAGVLRPQFDPAAIAKSYAAHGAACLSVLTDKEYFQGSIEDLKAVRAAVSLPLLRKDFILDPVQVLEARLAGASAALLIAECLSPAELADLVSLIESLAMTALVELHDPENLAPVIASGAKLIGINNRDLRTFKTDIQQTIDLVGAIPADRIVVSESGIRQRQDVDRLRAAGVGAILVGEAFMRADQPGEKLAELIG